MQISHLQPGPFDCAICIFISGEEGSVPHSVLDRHLETCREMKQEVYDNQVERIGIFSFSFSLSLLPLSLSLSLSLFLSLTLLLVSDPLRRIRRSEPAGVGCGAVPGVPHRERRPRSMEGTREERQRETRERRGTREWRWARGRPYTNGGGARDHGHGLGCTVLEVSHYWFIDRFVIYRLIGLGHWLISELYIVYYLPLWSRLNLIFLFEFCLVWCFSSHLNFCKTLVIINQYSSDQCLRSDRVLLLYCSIQILCLINFFKSLISFIYD